MATVSAIPVDCLSILSMPQAAEPVGLVTRAKAGDGSACQALFRAHAKRVYSLSLRLAGAEFEAENLTRDIFLATFANLNAIPNDDAFAAEVYRQSARALSATYFRRGVNGTGGQHLNPNQHLNEGGQRPAHLLSKFMNTTTTPRPVVVKQLPAQLKLGQVQEFLREVSPLITADRPCIVFDFSQVTQIDSAGVDMLLHCMEQAMKRNGDLKLAAVPPSSAVILELTRVDRLFEVFETSSEAVDSFYGFSLSERPSAQPTQSV